MAEEEILIVKWAQLPEDLTEIEDPAKETRIPYNPEDTILLVVVKTGEGVPRLLPVSIEDPGLFVSRSFPETWQELGSKVRAELSRSLK